MKNQTKNQKNQVFFVNVMNCGSGDQLFGIATSRKEANRLALDMICDFVDHRNEWSKNLINKIKNMSLYAAIDECVDFDFHVNIINASKKLNKICYRYE